MKHDKQLYVHSVVSIDTNLQQHRMISVVTACLVFFVTEVNSQLRLSDILALWTGADVVPPCGFDRQLTVEFYDPEISERRRLPSASTCSLTLRLLRNVHDPDILWSLLMDAVQMCAGFGKIWNKGFVKEHSGSLGTFWPSTLILHITDFGPSNYMYEDVVRRSPVDLTSLTCSSYRWRWTWYWTWFRHPWDNTGTTRFWVLLVCRSYEHLEFSRFNHEVCVCAWLTWPELH